jgi:hypothetical protein
LASTSARAIDRWCRRRFWKDAAPVARTYATDGGYCLHVDDIATTTGLIVKLDDGGDGTFETTIAASGYELSPAPVGTDGGIVDGIEGWPFHEIRLLDRPWPYPTSSGGSRRAQITATYGWFSVPDAVHVASLQVGAELFRRKDAPFGGVIGGTEFGPIRLSADVFRAVTSLLSDYRLYVHGMA